MAKRMGRWGTVEFFVNIKETRAKRERERKKQTIYILGREENNNTNEKQTFLYKYIGCGACFSLGKNPIHLY